MEQSDQYSVFMSYCWTNPEHEQWVHALAVRLMENGIEVKLDKWDLKPGQDKYVFMESMVQDPSISKVLLICDQGYKEKADKRTGGVGTETQIITKEVYDKTGQNKFIPIIAERGEQFDEFLPHYLKSRIGIDMSSEEVYESGYEQLLRLIADRPMFRKPAKGQLPSFLFDEEIQHKTRNMNKQLKNLILNKPDKANFVIQDFVEEFKNSLNQYRIDYSDFKEPYDELIYNKINDMKLLRDDYIEFLTLLCRSNLDIDVIIGLFEELYQFTESQEMGISNSLQFDHYKFFITELFIYTAIILIEHKLYSDLRTLLLSKYYINYKGEKRYVGFDKFRFYVTSLDEYRNNRLTLNRFCLTADLLVQRSVIGSKNYKDKLVDMDLILYYISTINFPENDDSYFSPCWYPTTYIYSDYKKIEFLNRLSSRRHFERVKNLFGVSTKDEMKVLIQKISKPLHSGIRGSYQNIPSIINHISPDDICIYE